MEEMNTVINVKYINSNPTIVGFNNGKERRKYNCFFCLIRAIVSSHKKVFNYILLFLIFFNSTVQHFDGEPIDLGNMNVLPIGK